MFQAEVRHDYPHFVHCSVNGVDSGVFPSMKRFFYHYYKAKKCMSVHFKGKCMIAKNIICEVPCETKWNDRQPNLIMRGFANEVKISREGVATIR